MWWVDSADAFRRWTFNDRPRPGEKAAMAVRLRRWETDGPPPITGYSKRGLRETTAPNGEVVEHDVLPLPESFRPFEGVIAIKEITSRH